MNKKLLTAIILAIASQSVQACKVFFTNNLNEPVTIVDLDNNQKEIELAPGDTQIPWGSKHHMAFFKASTAQGTPVTIKQIECTPTKKVYIQTSDIVTKNLDPQYFIIDPSDAELNEKHDCGCGA